MRALAAYKAKRLRIEGIDLDPEHVHIFDCAQDLQIAFGLGVEVEVEQQIDIRSGAVALNQPFTPTLVSAAGATYNYNRIDVTVAAHVNGALGSGAFSVAPFGLGTRVARVTGCLANPSPTVNLSVTPCAGVCP